MGPPQPLWAAPPSSHVSLLQRGPFPGLQSFRDNLLPPGLSTAAAPAGNIPLLRPLWGPPRAAGGVSAPAGSLQGCRGSLLRACTASRPPPHPPPGGPSSAPSSSSSSACAAFGPFWNLFSAILAEGLSCVLRWGRWSRLGPAGTGCVRHGAAPASPHTGRPAATLPAPGHRHPIHSLSALLKHKQTFRVILIQTSGVSLEIKNM